MEDRLTLSHEIVAAANELGGWLAQNDYPQGVAEDFELVVLAGNAVIPTIDAALRLASERGLPLLVSGGIGHSTGWLYRAVAADARYQGIECEGRSEADIIGDIARRHWQIDSARLIIENQSTNCGENAAFTRRTLEGLNWLPARALLVQDPTMQRRSIATFQRAWRGQADAPLWLSYPGVTPYLENSVHGVQFAGNHQGMWPVVRYLALITGELPRLRNDAQGYGPAGRDFMERVDIPPLVEQAWRELMAADVLQDIVAGRRIAG
ncbi:hypothetical protein TUM12370_20720 [Salmonella enterica subsp. enterica serovar Choleraesuis]|nr:hypothetical protein TUM12370_20720 [Salmonella enterica subsp. enterica serovar Choleraesuis]